MNRSYIHMLIAAFCWAGAFIAGKIGSATVSGLEMSFYRFTIAALCLLLYIRIRKYSFRIGARKFLIIAAIGSGGMIGYHLLFFLSIARINVLESSSINTLAPVLSAFTGYLFFKEPLNRKSITFLLGSTFGVLTIIIQWDFSALSAIGRSTGTLFMFGAMLVWVTYSLLIRKFVSGVPAAISSFISLGTAALLLLPFILIKGIPPSTYGINVWGVYLFMGIFSTFLGYTLQQDSIMKIGVSRTNFFINFVPVFSMILGVLILRDPFHMKYVISLAIIFTGLAGYMREKKKHLIGT